jgi:hypothetical protein
MTAFAIARWVPKPELGRSSILSTDVERLQAMQSTFTAPESYVSPISPIDVMPLNYRAVARTGVLVNWPQSCPFGSTMI